MSELRKVVYSQNHYCETVDCEMEAEYICENHRNELACGSCYLRMHGDCNKTNKLITAKMLYQLAVNFIEYVNQIGRHNETYDLSKRLDCFGEEYLNLAASTNTLEKVVYPILEQNLIDDFKKYYDQIIDLNLKLIKSDMFTQYSKFMTNISFMRNKHEAVAEKHENDPQDTKTDDELKKDIIKENQKKIKLEVDKAKTQIVKKLKEEHQQIVEAHLQEIEGLKAQMHELNSKVEDLEAQNHILSNSVEKSKADLEDANEKLNKAKTDCKELRSEYEKLQEEIKSKEATLEDLEDVKNITVNQITKFINKELDTFIIFDKDCDFEL